MYSGLGGRGGGVDGGSGCVGSGRGGSRFSHMYCLVVVSLGTVGSCYAVWPRRLLPYVVSQDCFAGNGVPRNPG